MPIRRGAPSAVEVVLARESCEPLLSSVTHRLLRGGFAQYISFRRAYARECERSMASSKLVSGPPRRTGVRRLPPQPGMHIFSGSGATAGLAALCSSPKPAQEVPHTRINPEGLKVVFAESGILLSSENYTEILLAYSDSVGFVLADDLLAALHPNRHIPPALAQNVSEVFSSTFFAALPQSCRFVTLESARDVLSAIFAVQLSSEEAEGDAVSAHTTAAQISALTRAQADVQASFTPNVYGEAAAVPCDDVTTLVGLILHQHPCLASMVSARFKSVASLMPLVPASSPSSQDDASRAPTSTISSIDGSALFSIRHTGSTTRRKFERYEEDKDRRDEWIHGREEADARSMYMRHAAGYGGHLPEYQYRFGRTFHVIEEDLPQLTKPKPPLEPVPADWYGHGVVLKDSRMNAHHYRFA
ncbi:hypothetical protein JKF63_04557 [Porcisia hertigi]|uniref:Uncharacterized protein n=1 Tax=Porcisia hertigi TaxID=2761500 RepID=A0A836L8T2_9TRYP|nr:hypothetical protein JKF63_04557 [Porcisia hertigi]